MEKKRILLVTLVLLGVYHANVMFAQGFIDYAQTPPMGWNSYNAFGATVRESEVRENADFIANETM